MSPKRILFVCTGNSCRSVMAQGLMQRLVEQAEMDNVLVESAGVYAVSGMPASRETQRVLQNIGVDCSNHRARLLTPEMIRQADFLFAMELFQLEAIIHREPSAVDKVHLLKTYGLPLEELPSDPSIPDPIGKPLEIYEICFSEIARAVERIVKLLVNSGR